MYIIIQLIIMLQLFHIQYMIRGNRIRWIIPMKKKQIISRSPSRLSHSRLSHSRLSKLTKMELINLCQERNISTQGCRYKNDFIGLLTNTTLRSGSIPASAGRSGSLRSTPIILKTQVWNNRIGKYIGCIKCPMCLTNEITQLSYEKAHIISRKHGGENTVDNLVPMCNICNKSLGINDVNMDVYNKNLLISRSRN
jgi:hypothetical protein